jgi:hypothetical protein
MNASSQKSNNMKNLKTTMIAALLMLAAVGEVVAQEKWEYATISYYWGYAKLSVSLDGKQFLEEKVELPKGEAGPYNSNPLLNKVHEYEDKGWEVMNVNAVPSAGGGAAYFACLRKKKQ